MTYFNSPEPNCDRQHCPKHVTVEILPRSVDLGGFEVRRVLPSSAKRTVGPFVFWDQAGPGEFLQGKGLDVRPHPHICLSTMTYLFAGSLEHRDTLGSHQVITPGAVNFMTAGSGIAHSERTPLANRLAPSQFFGIQSWLALPLDKEEMSPAFAHHDQAAIPVIKQRGLEVKVVAGVWQGLKSPVETYTDAIFLECQLAANETLTIPASEEERALHILAGEVEIDHVKYPPTMMLVLQPKQEINITALSDVHAILLGGSPLTEPRYLWWNFVASRKERIEQAKLDWVSGKFGLIPGDDKEYIPLPT